jgi:hypothetical protein
MVVVELLVELQLLLVKLFVHSTASSGTVVLVILLSSNYCCGDAEWILLLLDLIVTSKVAR